MTEGSKTVVISGTTDDPEAFRREKSFAPDGGLIEELRTSTRNCSPTMSGSATARRVRRRTLRMTPMAM